MLSVQSQWYLGYKGENIRKNVYNMGLDSHCGGEIHTKIHITTAGYYRLIIIPSDI